MPDVELSFNRYRYVPTNITITVPKEEEEDLNLTFAGFPFTYLTIGYDYVGRRMPWIQGSIEMETKYIAEIYNNVDVTRLTMEVIEQRVDEDSNVLETKPRLREPIIIVILVP